jgi:hypothetical protein
MSKIGSRGRINRLPWIIRRQLNEKLRDNRQLQYIAEWLFQQTAPEDLPELGLQQGEPFGKMYENLADPLHNCEIALSKYRLCSMYRLWFAEEKRSGAVGAALSNLAAVDDLSRQSKQTADGVNSMALSLILEKMEGLAGDKTASVADLKELTGAVATINGALVASQKAEIEMRKLELLERAEGAKAAAKKPPMTPEEKERRMKEIFGIQ